MKKLINNAEDVTREQLLGLQSAHEEALEVRFDPTFVMRKSPPGGGGGSAKKVALVSGEGNGDGPLHDAYVE